MAKMFVNGQWAEAASQKTYEVCNPANGQVVDTACLAGPQDVEAAVSAAQAAARAWAETAPDDRAAVLHKGVQLVEAKAKEIAALLTAEQGKPLFEAQSEVHHLLHCLEFYAG